MTLALALTLTKLAPLTLGPLWEVGLLLPLRGGLVPRGAPELELDVGVEAP